MNIDTLEKVYARLLERADKLDAETEQYRTGEVVDDEAYAQLVFKRTGVIDAVHIINSMMTETINELIAPREDDDMSDEVRQLVKMGR